MIRTILYNLKKRIILFLTNKTNNEYLSKSDYALSRVMTGIRLRCRRLVES